MVLISPHQFTPAGSFLAKGLFYLVLSEYANHALKSLFEEINKVIMPYISQNELYKTASNIVKSLAIFWLNSKLCR